jgi:hypothetical protein
MADEKPKDTAAETPKTPEAADPNAPKTAKVGHKDKGSFVTGALGEPLSGSIADISDGDD